MTFGLILLGISVVALWVTWAMRAQYARSKALRDLYPIIISELPYEHPLTEKWVAVANSIELPNCFYIKGSEISNFWISDESLLIGRGTTPNQALKDLAKRHGPSLIRIDLTD